MVARLRKKNNLARRTTARQRLEETAPNPIRGYGPGNEKVWLGSELRKILLQKDEVWAGPTPETQDGAVGDLAMLPPLSSSSAELLGPTGTQALLAGPSDSQKQSQSTALVSTDPSSQAVNAPAPLPYLNFGLSAEDAKLLFEQLPQASAELSVDPQYASSRPAKVQKALVDEEQKADSLKRILDMRNANSRGIRFENTRRIIRRFGQGEGTGRCEVQGELPENPIIGLTC